MRIWRLVLNWRPEVRFCAEESAQAIQAEPISGNFMPLPLVGWKRIVDELAAILIAIELAAEDVAEFSSSTGGQPCLRHRATSFEGSLRGRFLGTEIDQTLLFRRRVRQPASKNWRVFFAPALPRPSRT
jgi:hypothetical protein